MEGDELSSEQWPQSIRCTFVPEVHVPMSHHFLAHFGRNRRGMSTSVEASVVRERLLQFRLVCQYSLCSRQSLQTVLDEQGLYGFALPFLIWVLQGWNQCRHPPSLTCLPIPRY